MIVGFDFDNTIIDYTNTFKEIAYIKKLIPQNIPGNKNSIRNYLRDQNKEKEWTILQGEVYGSHIMRAKIYKGVKEAFIWLSKNNIKTYIISHKTQFPYLGKKINLRVAALKWIEDNVFLNEKQIKLTPKEIFFENTIEEKIERIKELNCNIYIDDLPEVLKLLPNNIIKILFSPNSKNKDENNLIMNKWSEITDIIKIR